MCPAPGSSNVVSGGYRIHSVISIRQQSPRPRAEESVGTFRGAVILKLRDNFLIGAPADIAPNPEDSAPCTSPLFVPHLDCRLVSL